MKNKNKFSFALFLILCMISVTKVFSQQFPEKPYPPMLVNDFAGVLKPDQVSILENRLVSFNDSTSTQIAIVTVPDLMGYDKSEYAQQLAEKWGIGRKDLNSGILILIKPKTSGSRGEVFIATGYGLEGAIPDLTCNQIIENEMIPAFREGDYFTGLQKSVTVLMSLARGEFSADQYGKSMKKSTGGGFPVGLIIFIIFFIVLISGSSGKSNQRHISSKGLPLWLLLSMMNSGRGSHGGSWGGFSGGGGSSGGFGGFGGGSFGGGGAGGSW
jgi:uncharacterized protein